MTVAVLGCLQYAIVGLAAALGVERLTAWLGVRRRSQVLEYVQRHPDCTSYEIASGVGVWASGLLSDLEREGRLESFATPFDRHDRRRPYGYTRRYRLPVKAVGAEPSL